MKLARTVIAKNPVEDHYHRNQNLKIWAWSGNLNSINSIKKYIYWTDLWWDCGNWGAENKRNTGLSWPEVMKKRGRRDVTRRYDNTR